jgi:DNA-binding transcriptional MerR regulator
VNSTPSAKQTLRTGELAEVVGVSADTVRFYERRGLLPAAARSASGYRLFSQDALPRIRLIRAAFSMGFSATELAGVFRERESGAALCRRVRKMAAEKLRALEAQLSDLRSWRDELRNTLREWDRLLAKTTSGKRAHLLEAFAASHPKNSSRRPFRNVLARQNRKQENET